MTQQPAEGPLHPNYGPFIRNVREIAPGLFVADAVRGMTGKGRAVFQVVLQRNPDAGQLKNPKYPQWGVEPDFLERGRLARRTQRGNRGFGFEIAKRGWSGGEYMSGFNLNQQRAYEMFVVAAKEVFR